MKLYQDEMKRLNTLKISLSKNLLLTKKDSSTPSDKKMRMQLKTVAPVILTRRMEKFQL
jgi:hypothetical protein